MKGGKYTKTLAKIWVELIIRIRDVRNKYNKIISTCLPPKAVFNVWRLSKRSKVHDMMTSCKNVLQYKFSYSVLLISAGNANQLKRNIFLNNFFR